MCLANKTLKRTFLRGALCFRINFRLHSENDGVECRLGWKFLVGRALSSGAVVGETFGAQKNFVWAARASEFFISANHKAQTRKEWKVESLRLPANFGWWWIIANWIALKRKFFLSRLLFVNFYFLDIFMSWMSRYWVKRSCIELFLNWKLNSK